MKFKAFAIIPHTGEIEIKPLVLCRECKWWDDRWSKCERWLPSLTMKTPGEWFCADGEKGEEDAEKNL